MRSRLGLLLGLLGVLLLGAGAYLLCHNSREAAVAAARSAKVLPLLRQAIETQHAAGTTAEVEGDCYLGILTIPALDLELPVLASGTDLDAGVCRYAGSTAGKDLVLIAHNYPGLFGGLEGLTPGDQVYFTDAGGRTTRYRVTASDVLEPTAVEAMTDGGHALTLVTCTYGGRNRVTVRCDPMEENEKYA